MQRSVTFPRRWSRSTSRRPWQPCGANWGGGHERRLERYGRNLTCRRCRALACPSDVVGLHAGRAREVQSLAQAIAGRSEEHTSELQSLMRISYAVFCLKKKKE